MSVFNVSYWRKGKEKGKQGFVGFFRSTTYESVLMDSVLNSLCESAYSMHFERFFLNNDIFIQRTKANGSRCEYKVFLYEHGNNSNLLSEYVVEIECIENDRLIDVLIEEQTFMQPNKLIRKKNKLHTEWFKNESNAIKFFLLNLERVGSLNELRKSGEISKPTFQRNLKICKEKGYIKNNKLVKRIFMTKFEN